MSRRFDASLKHLVEHYPEDWVRLIGIAVNEPVEVIDADLATVTAEADKVVHLGGATPWILHAEFQSTYERDFPDRLQWYNSLLWYRHRVPVLSVVFLLRPRAEGPALAGTLRRELPSGRQYLEFSYDIVKVWQLPLEAILAGGVGVLPLAPLAAVSEKKLPQVIREMERRFDREADQTETATLWTATYVLMGLSYPAKVAENLIRGVRTMKDSVTYQAIVQEGFELGKEEAQEEAARELQDLVLSLGTQRWGEPDKATRRKLAAVSDFSKLKKLTARLLTASGWKELLASNGKKR